MKKALFFIGIGVVALVLVFQAARAVNFEPSGRTVAIPHTAVKVAPGVFQLVSARDVDGRMVEGYAFIHYKDDLVRGGGSSSAAKVPSCYGFLANGAKWKALEPWVVNPANSRGLTSNFVSSNLTGDIAKWEDAADGILNGASKDILGNGTVTTETLVADTSAPDNKNEVYFADIASSNAIAITIVWGIFSGPPFQRKLVEWDQVYDDVDFDWSANGESAKMDFENIATHELGHSVGLSDMYSTGCSEVTMYGYAAYGETKKRTLEPPDVKGVYTLYL